MQNNVRMSKIMHTPIKVGVRAYVRDVLQLFWQLEYVAYARTYAYFYWRMHDFGYAYVNILGGISILTNTKKNDFAKVLFSF